MSLFSSPFLLGFEPFERALDRVAKSAGDGYPPYNVEQIGDNRLRITVAVAGFSPDELSVQVEGNQLVVRGRQEQEQPERVFLHRGIAARQFQRAFVLADGIEVTTASLDNGLLAIELERPLQEPAVKTIAISKAPKLGSGPASTGSAANGSGGPSNGTVIGPGGNVGGRR